MISDTAGTALPLLAFWQRTFEVIAPLVNCHDYGGWNLMGIGAQKGRGEN